MKRARDSHFFVLADFLQLAKRSKKRLLLGAILFMGVSFFLSLYRGVTYKAEAIFREISTTIGKDSSQSLNAFLEAAGKTPVAKEAAILFHSPIILSKVIGGLGLQIEYCPSLIEALKTRLLLLLAAEGKRICPSSSFVFQDVECLVKSKRVYRLVFLSKEIFEMQTEEGERVALGKVGEKITFAEGSFTLARVPKELSLSKSYRFRFLPLFPVFSKVKKRLHIKQPKKSPSLFHLTFFHSDRELALSFLNQTMATYKKYLEKEKEEVVKQQLDYLQSRQNDVKGGIEKEWKKYASHLKKNLEEKGLFTLTQEMEIVEKKQRDYGERLIALELEKSRLLHPHFTPLAKENPSPLGQLHEQLLAMHKKKKEKKFILATPFLLRDSVNRLEHATTDAQRMRESVSARMYPKEVDQLVSRTFGNLFCLEKRARKKKEHCFPPSLLDEGKSVHRAKTAIETLLFEVKQTPAALLRCQWHDHFTLLYPKVVFPANREEMILLLEEECDFFQMQDEIYRKHWLYQRGDSSSFFGADLATVESLYLDYVKSRDAFLEQKRKLLAARKKLHSLENLEGMVSDLLPNQEGKNLANALRELTESLQNTRYFSLKEREKMVGLYEDKRKELFRYLSQQEETASVQIHLLEEKIRGAARTALQLIYQEIALIEREIANRTEKEIAQIEIEKKLLQNQIDQLKEQVRALPDHWLQEKEIELNTDLGLKMLETVAKVIESKNGEYHLAESQSKTVSLAFAPFTPRPPLLFFWLILSGALGGGITWLSLLLRKGEHIEITKTHLEQKGYPLFGQQPSLLEGLGKLDLFFSREFEVACFLFSSPHWKELRSFFALQTQPTIVLDFRSSSPPSSRGGIVSYLKGNTDLPPAPCNQEVDLLFWDGTLEEQLVLLKGERFFSYIRSLRCVYKRVLLLSSTSLESTLAQLLSFVSNTFVIEYRSFEQRQLDFYVDWMAASRKRKLAFLDISS